MIVAYPHANQVRAVVCGPAGDSPAVADLDLNQAERLAASALAGSNRHLAAQVVQGALEQAGEDVPGLRNRGLLSTHELLNGVPFRSDWEEATAKARAALPRRDHDLVRALGYQIEQAGKHHVLRTNSGAARAVAVFLQANEQPELPSYRYDLQSPVTYALAQADRESLPWVISVRGSAIRLYSTTTGGAVGQRGRAETYVELDLSLLPSDKAGYLHLLFSADALTQGGVFYEIQRASRDFTTALSERLRERVYEQVVPRLALTIADHVGGSSEADLAQHYRTALTILFRLLFIAYAEDSRLLPLHVNGDYTDNSLKALAQRFAEGINAGRDLGFDDPFTGVKSQHPDVDQDDLWRACQTLFRAVDKGHQRWGIPAYNGGLFSSDPGVNPVGGVIAGLNLNNAAFGPALAALIVDRTPDGVVGPIDFRSLSVREFGTIYEGLLESELSVAEQDLTLGRDKKSKKDDVYLPAQPGDPVVVPAGAVYLHNKSGQRKATGSYFTKSFAVDHLLDHALDPTLDEHLERVAKLLARGDEAGAAEALFDFRVADISMGSGHFLTAVVDRIEARIGRFLAEHPIPQVTSELDTLRNQAMKALGENAVGVEIENASLLRRLIARRCVYGVDVNPISVELARVSMWIHTFVPGLPLSFLNHNLVVGDSLTGIATIEEAARAITQGQGDVVGLFDDPLRAALRQAEEPLGRLARLVDATPSDVEAARAAEIEVKRAIEPVTAFFDVTVAVRTRKREKPLVASPGDLLALTDDPSRAVAQELGSLHFPVAFPEVFLRERPGFDVIVGNPPWEELTLEEHAFWARHFPGLRAMPQRRQEAEKNRLRRERPDLVDAYERERAETDARRQVLMSGPFPGMGTGDPDLYKAFAWRFWQLLRAGGRIGVVVPRSLLAAKGSAEFREALLDGATHVDITALTNSGGWVFDEAEHRYTIGLIAIQKRPSREKLDPVLSLRGPYRSMTRFQAGRANQPTRVLGSELRSWNDTASLPLLPTEESAEVFLQLRKAPRLDLDDGKSWRARPHTELHATNDKQVMDLDSEQRPEG